MVDGERERFPPILCEAGVERRLTGKVWKGDRLGVFVLSSKLSAFPPAGAPWLTC
jgi:hypothetical protein